MAARPPTQAPVALVTGGARRIGAAIARRLHAAGYALVVHYRSGEADALALRAELEARRRDSVLLVPAELADPAAPAALVGAALAHFGRLDALVNNASAFYPTPIDVASQAQWDELFASNARAPFFLAQAAAPHLCAARGAIVNLLDIHVERPPREARSSGAAACARKKGARALAANSSSHCAWVALAIGVG